MHNTNQSRELRLITRDRKREFNDVRQSHSRRKDFSQSQLSKSVGKSRVNREFQNLRETSRFNNQQNEQSRCLREIKQSQNNLTSRSHRDLNRDLMCPCCYNKKQAQLKQQRRKHEQRLEEAQIKQIKQSIFQNNLQKQLQYENHIKHNIQEMNQFNKKLMEKHQLQKMEELNQKKHQGELVKMEKQIFDMEKENKAKHSLQIRQLLKQKYEEQMRIKEEKQNMQKKMNQTFDQQNFVVDAILPGKPQLDKSTAQNTRKAYKEELLRQIQQRQAKKKSQIEDLKGLQPQKQVPQFQLVTFAQKRNEQAKRIARQLKQKQLSDMNEKKNKQQFQREQKQMYRIERQRERKKIIAQAQAQKMHQEEVRRQKIDNYLSDLKTQIEQNKKKRLQELQWINQRKLAEPIIKPREEREFDKDSCKGCHKKYPKKMLTEFVTILE